jgi:hypothetical protein
MRSVSTPPVGKNRHPSRNRHIHLGVSLHPPGNAFVGSEALFRLGMGLALVLATRRAPQRLLRRLRLRPRIQRHAFRRHGTAPLCPLPSRWRRPSRNPGRISIETSLLRRHNRRGRSHYRYTPISYRACPHHGVRVGGNVTCRVGARPRTANERFIRTTSRSSMLTR